MDILVVEDDTTSRRVLVGYLSSYGKCDTAVDGQEAVDSVKVSLENKQPYDLICLDIMMPSMNGQEALAGIRELEEFYDIAVGDGAKVIMTTALSDSRNVLQAFNSQCEAYLVKPINRAKLVEQLVNLELIPSDTTANH